MVGDDQDGAPLMLEDVIRYAPSVFPAMEAIRLSNFPVKAKIKRLVF